MSDSLCTWQNSIKNLTKLQGFSYVTLSNTMNIDDYFTQCKHDSSLSMYYINMDENGRYDPYIDQKLIFTILYNAETQNHELYIHININGEEFSKSISPITDDSFKAIIEEYIKYLQKFNNTQNLIKGFQAKLLEKG